MSTALLFSGQGAALNAIGAQLFKANPWLLQVVRPWSEHIDLDIPALLTQNIASDDIQSVHIAMVSYALLAFEVLSKEHSFALLAGHSLGEISALTCAGALSPIHGLRLAKKRGELLHKASQKSQRTMGTAETAETMLAIVGLAIAETKMLIEDFLQDKQIDNVYFANYNSPKQLVLSGEKSSLQRVQEYVAEQAQGIKTVFLPVNAAFHSPYMASASEELYDFALTLPWQRPNIALISSVDGKLLNSSNFATHCALQITSPVRFIDVMQCMQRASITKIIEVNTAGVLSRMCQELVGWKVDSSVFSG